VYYSWFVNNIKIINRILSLSSKKSSGTVFVSVFVIIWIGSIIITFNTKLLGGSL
jgi:hypothetical protein